MRTLEEDGLLDDEIINAYFAALTSGTGGKVLGFSVFWLPVMKSLHWPSDAVQNTLQERGAAAAQVWIMPYNRSGIHWAQFMVFRAAKRIFHLDSFLFGAPADALRLVQLLLECVQPEASPIDRADWDLVVPENTPPRCKKRAPHAVTTFVGTLALLRRPSLRQLPWTFRPCGTRFARQSLV